MVEFDLDGLAATLHQTSVEKGFWDGPTDTGVVNTKLLLIHSEVTEVMEAIRKDKGELEVVKELADILVRTLDLYAGMMDAELVHDSLHDVFEMILEKNKERPQKHGVNF